MTNTTTPNPLPEVLSKDHVFLSVESTDLNGRIIKIQIVDHQGNFLLDTLVHPRWKIKENCEASRKHRITNAIAKDAPRWKDLLPAIKKHTDGKKVIVYNDKFVNAVFYTTSAKYKTEFITLDLFCLMAATAQIIGVWSDYQRDYIPIKLFKACYDNDINYNDNKKALMLYKLADFLKTKNQVIAKQ